MPFSLVRLPHPPTSRLSASAAPGAPPARRPGVTVSVVSHAQAELVATLLADLVRVGPVGWRRLVLTLNVEEPAPELPAIEGCEVTVVRNPQPIGFGSNHNQAFRHCDTDWFAVLNPDLRCTADFLGTALADARPGDALLAPRVCELDGTAADATRRLLTPWQVLSRRLGAGDRVRSQAGFDWIAGMCVLVRSEAFEQVGGFDERYFMYCEDADLCLRLRLAGWQIRRVDAGGVIHAAQRASHRSLRHLGWHLTSLVKHWISPAFWRYRWRRRELQSRR